MPRSLPLTPNVERLFLQRVRRLPEPAQRCSRSSPRTRAGARAVMRASEAVGYRRRRAASRRARRAGRGAGRAIDVRHPLVRSAILQGLSSEERRAAHLALASALDDEESFDERTWHLAAAAAGPDAELAAALEEVAERARRRSAHAPARAPSSGRPS